MQSIQSVHHFKLTHRMWPICRPLVREKHPPPKKKKKPKKKTPTHTKNTKKNTHTHYFLRIARSWQSSKYRSMVIHSRSQRLHRNRPGSDSYDLSLLLARKITKGIHSCKSASLNRPVGLSVVEPGSATGCNCWSYSQVRGTCFSLAVCQLVPYIITWLQVRQLYFFTVEVAVATCLVGSC